jgi:splicing factor 3A subunit 2
MDFQDRPGGKAGGGGAASAQQEAIDRRERLRKLALETIDLAKDPYFMRNHVGQYECRLCLTIHPNEGNYLAHTQGKRHQENLARRAFLDAQQKAALPQPAAQAGGAGAGAGGKRKGVRIGRPGYRVVRQRDPETGQRSLLFEVEYPEIEEGLQPRHRFMSAFEQRVETPDKAWQYLLFAAEPYETVAFKVPSWPVDRDRGGGAGRRDKFHSSWDPHRKVFTLLVHFTAPAGAAGAGGAGAGAGRARVGPAV